MLTSEGSVLYYNILETTNIFPRTAPVPFTSLMIDMSLRVVNLLRIRMTNRYRQVPTSCWRAEVLCRAAGHKMLLGSDGWLSKAPPCAVTQTGIHTSQIYI